VQKEIGSKCFPIWLMGDSNPKNWADKLKVPLDPRHPAIHNIWTPILENIQDKVYREAGLRIDTTDIYIRNAIENSTEKPKNIDMEWSSQNQEKISELRDLINQFHPTFLFCFGAFSFEFCRRAIGEGRIHPYKYWSTKKLGEQFRYQINNFQVNQINIFPLLHATIARRYFLISHNYYCGYKGANYFNYVGDNIAELMLKTKDKLTIWI
jgi:hypothetical protein